MFNKTLFLVIMLLFSATSFNTVSAQKPAALPVKKVFTGIYTSEGDIQQLGVLKFDLNQSSNKLEGVANYKTFDGQIDTGVLSVNGYVSLGKAFVRFRDQRGNTVADGIMSFKANQVMVFKQTTKYSRLPKSTVLRKSSTDNKPQPPKPPARFNGKYSTQGNSNGTKFTMEILQNGGKISGTANYNAGYGQNNSGILSVFGNVEGSRAYVKFLDQRGNTVAEGSLSTSSPNEISFTQNTNSVLLPNNARLYKQFN